jgi:hypothetical protein
MLREKSQAMARELRQTLGLQALEPAPKLVALPHFCHARGCKEVVPRELLMCAAHWRLVPRTLQRAVWLAYQPGQEAGKAPLTSTYLDAARAAIEAVVKAERDPLQMSLFPKR